MIARLARPVALLFALLLSAPAPAHAGQALDEARNKLARGDYTQAIAALEKLAARSPDAQESLARAYLDVGRYEDATATASKLAERRGHKWAGEVLLGTVELLTGKYDEAIRRLRAVVRGAPQNFEARIRLAEAKVATGARYDQLSEADAIVEFWQDGKVTDAAGLIWMARALHLMAYYKNANEIFIEALQKDPKYALGHLYWAMLFLEKEDEGEADKSLAAVLAINPNHAHALALTGFIDVSSEADSVKALEHVRTALEVNDRFVPALQVLAHILIGTEQFGAALEQLNKALETNPNDPKTLAMVAACHLLLEDDAAYRRALRQALKVNRRFAEGYHIVAEYLVRQHRYEEAVKLEQKAIRLDSEYWPSYVGLGMGYSRIGKDEEASEMLRRAADGDSFNVRAFNMTEHFYEGPVRQMSWERMGAFNVRMHASEVDVLKSFLPDFLATAFRTHRRKYGFKPRGPLHLELFPDTKTFAVRTTGYPGLGAHGVCFGHVVTARSPSQGNFNWAMVLWHELAHVWHIQMSDSRVPRWFTEGLAEHETTLRRPEWKREMNAELWAAQSSGRLRGIAEFNTMFTHAKSIPEIVLAYYYASKVVGFIDKTWGFEVFPKMLREWGKHRPTERVFQSILGVDLATFDARMTTYLQDELLVAFRDEFVPLEGEAAGAASLAYTQATAALEAKRFQEAAEGFDEVLKAGKDGPELRMLAARAAIGLEDWATARKHLEAAIRLNPQHDQAYAGLHKVLEQLGDDDAMYELMKRAAVHEEHGLELLFKILRQARTRGTWEDVKTYTERAMHIGPFNPAVHAFRGELLLHDGNIKDAQAAVDLALSMDGGPDTKVVRFLEARILAARGKLDDARQVLDRLGSGEDVVAVRTELGLEPAPADPSPGPTVL